MKRVLILGAIAVASMAAADLAPILKQVESYEYGQNPAAVRGLEQAALQSAGTPDAAAIEKQVIAAFPGAKTEAARDVLFKALAIVGSNAAVPLLASKLTDPKTVEMARYALEQIPGDASTAALRAALPKVPATAQAGIAVSLGKRKDTAAPGILKPLLASTDPATANAVATALRHIGTAEARQALLAAKPTNAVSDALLEIAERAPAGSAAIYRHLYSKANTEAVQIAALHGLSRTDPQAATPLLLAALKSDSTRLQATAIRELAAIEGADLAKRIPASSPRVQVQIIAALVDSASVGGPLAPILEQQLASSNESVRIAALNGIARFGSAKQIPLLASRAASSSGDEQAAARAALGMVRGKNADAAILSAIATADPKVKIELIRATGERGIASASPVLLRTATDVDSKIRTESIRALRETAGPAEVPSLVGLLVKSEDETDREEFERTVAAAIRRSKDAPIEELVRAYQSSTDPDVQSSILGVLAAVGNNSALPLLRNALRASDADVQRAALNALAAWPTPEPMSDLLTIAQTSGNLSRQVLALRAYVRLAQIPSNRPPAETAQLLAAAMAAAKRPEEKKIVIAAAQRVVAPESLELVKGALHDPGVSAEAKAAVTALERGLMYRRN